MKPIKYEDILHSTYLEYCLFCDENFNTMGILNKILNPITHSQDLNDEIEKYNKVINDYNKLCVKLQSDAINLYELRKKTLKKVLQLDSYVEHLEDCPDCIIKSTKRAISFYDNIQKAWNFENAPHDVNSKAGDAANAALAGAAAAGGVVAVAGPTAAMAIATTFGTASTGAAISSLGGAAAANAALAWLGGGAVAAGGGGMAAGASLLGMMGPLGWGIAGIAGGAIIVKSLRDKSKNDEEIRKIKEQLSVIQNEYSNKNKMYSRLSGIINHTKTINNKLDLARLESVAKNSFSNKDYPHSLLFEYVHYAKFAGKLSKESINVNQA